MLVIDAGNSRIKWGWWSDGEIAQHGLCEHAHELPSPGDIGLVARAGERAVAVSVAAPAMREALTASVRARWGRELAFLRPQRCFGRLVCAYQQPARLGVDRWAAIVGAAQTYGTPALVVDCGTAVTIDHVDARGRHQGGVIFPGLGTMRRALHTGTANLPEVAGPADGVLGTDTVEAIRNGTFYAVVGAIDRIVAPLAESANASHRLLTGGDAALLREHLALDYQLDSLLVLRGAAWLALGP